MRLQHVTIDNCAWCPPLSDDVRGHMVLVGPNESGKSTVLRLIDAALAWTNGRLLSELSPAALRSADEALVVQLVLGELDAEAQAAFPDEIEVMEDGVLKLTVRMEVSRSTDDPLSAATLDGHVGDTFGGHELMCMVAPSCSSVVA